MASPESDQPADQFRRDRHEHGGSPRHLDDDQLARLTEEERVAAGLEDYDPDDIPPADDAPYREDVRGTEEYRQAREAIRRQLGDGESPAEGEPDPYPPTRHER